MEPFDCELFANGLLTQPINAISALAFLVVAVGLWPRRPDSAVITAATGLGSFWFHAAPGGAASWAHDITLYALIALAAVEVWRRFATGQVPVMAITVFLVGLVFWSIGRTGSPFCHPDSALQWHAVWHLLAATASVALFTGQDQPKTGA